MKTLEINRKTINNFDTNAVFLDKTAQVPDLEIINHQYNAKTGQTYIIVSTQILRSDNYKIFLHGNHLGLVISEHIEFNKPLYLRHYNLQSYQQQSYERFHSASVLLAGYNYYLVNYLFIPEKNHLEIVLGNTLIN